MTDTGLQDSSGVVRPSSIEGLPTGYRYGVTRFADVILRDAFPDRFNELMEALTEYQIDAHEILSGGGSRATHTQRFDAALGARGWGKRTVRIEKYIDGQPIHATRGHEIDMFKGGTDRDAYPGVAVEMEWNNKDPFFDRDLQNFMTLHREGALAIGIIVTRGPELQRAIGNTVKSGDAMKSVKYGQSTTHWAKLVPRLNLGGGGECPIIVVGIEPGRVIDFDQIALRFPKR